MEIKNTQIADSEREESTLREREREREGQEHLRGTCKCGDGTRKKRRRRGKSETEKHMDESHRWWRHAAKHRETVMKKEAGLICSCVFQ